MGRFDSRPIVAGLIGFVLIAVFLDRPLASQSGSWYVAAAANAFIARPDGTAPVSASIGYDVGEGDRLKTGSGGRLVLARGEDLVAMSENSEIVLAHAAAPEQTLIEQPVGHVEYHVTKRATPHFEVDTPLLATVVKGTTFAVSAGPSQSSVNVSEGRVIAKDRRSGESFPVSAGEVGAVEAGRLGVSARPGSSGGGGSSANGGSGNGNSGSNKSGGSSGGGEKGSGGGNGSGNSGGNGSSGGNAGGNGSGGGNAGGNGNGGGNAGGNGNGGGNAGGSGNGGGNAGGNGDGGGNAGGNGSGGGNTSGNGGGNAGGNGNTGGNGNSNSKNK